MYATPRGIARRKMLDNPARGKKLRAFAKHRDDMQTLNADGKKSFSLGMMTALRTLFGGKDR